MAIKVLVVQEQPQYDYSAAERYGDVTFVSAFDLSPMAQSLRNKEIMAAMRKAMSDYIPGIDYILPSGSPINIAAIMMLAGRMGSKHKILKWDNRSNSYAEVILEIGE